MGGWLTRSFQEHSIFWLLASSMLGGVIGASLKFLFESFLPQQLTHRREIIAVKRKYSTPILLASEELRRRLHNMITLIQLIETESGWLQSDEPNGYYYVSTIYTVARFLGWQQILRREVVYLDFTTTNETKTFEAFMRAIREGFSNPDLICDNEASAPEESEDKWIYSFWLQGIGDSMIVEKGDNCYAMNYASFLTKIGDDKNTDLREWLNALRNLFADLKSTDLKFKRIVALHSLVNAFIDYVDPQHLRTGNQPYHWDLLTEDEAERIRKEIRAINPKAELIN